MKSTFLIFLSLLTLGTHAAPPLSYPLAPDPRLTPGSLCTEPDSYRHPEQIPYCERNVNSFLKESIFIAYRRDLGYRLSGDRRMYKIDHLIPLCAGGSNNQDNLWPQHIKLSTITDQIESVGCEKLSKEKITQKALIDLIMKAKMDLSKASKILKDLKKIH